MDNYEIADSFSLLSKLMDIHGENSFKVKNYSIAAFNIEKLPNPLSAMDTATIAALKGIGESTAKKIAELLAKGSLAVLDELVAKTPPGILEMMNIKGIGPKKIHTIWKEMEIESVGELLYACNENRLTLYKGFGAKTQENVKESIEYYLSQQGFFLYQQASELVENILKTVTDKFRSNQTFVTGDFRRQMEIIERMEYVSDIPKEMITSFFDEQPGFHFVSEEDDVLTYRLETGPPLKWHCSNTASIAIALFESTGNAGFVLKCKELFPGVFAVNAGINEEKDIFDKAGLPFIPACLRDQDDILELVKRQSLPTLVQPEDIRGIIHSHSKWSDGTHTILEMATAAKLQGLEYLVISDHSKSAGYANGLTVDRIAQQHAEIDELNRQLAPFKIFKSIESDVLVDGSLDYADEVLAGFDLVIASVHSVLKMTEEKAMARLIKAIENPYTTILGHMTGRLLLSRGGYPVNHHKIIDACAANDVVIELNAHPRRLDMDWRWLRYAMEKNVLISIDPDAHFVERFSDTRFGVLAAQKGMLTPDRNLSSFTLPQFEVFLQKRLKPAR